MAKNKQNDELVLKVRDLDIKEEMAKDFVVYSQEVNAHRAFPYVLPGIKPIAGHAIWSMYYNKRTSNKPYTKSAKVEGEVMSFSPHGGSYGALARMAADYIYHIPYIDGHGSFGSVVGGPTPGAARYTEMRLSEFTEDVLLYNTKLLDMGLNYLEEDPEPRLDKWVALLPLLFMTNTSGMGYTASNTWSSGNLKEFAVQLHNYIDNGVVDCSEMYPDFPTGGVIINKSDMKNLYETGQGTIKLRGKTEIDGNTIRILSLPYQTYPEQFIEDIKKYVSNNPNTIKDLSNMCGMNGFLIEIECEEGTAEYTLDCLFKKTCLQINISDEHKAIDSSGKPVLITLESYMKDFIAGNIELVIKEATLNLEDINHRLEIVNGLLSALDVIDEIIALIKKSKSQDDAKKAISDKFGFTEVQATAIVGTTLGKLANLEQIKLQEEKNTLEKNKKENEKLISSRKAQEKYFLNRFDKLVEKYGWDRKTEVADITVADVATTRVAKPAQLKPKKEFMVVLTSENCLKRVDVMKFRQTEEDSKNIKVAGNQKVVLVSNKGIMYKVWSNSISLCMPTSAGDPINSLVNFTDPNETILAIYSDDIDLPNVYFVTKNGLGKMSRFKDTLGVSKTVGTIVCGFKSDDDELIAIKLLNDGENIELTTSEGRKEVITPDKAQGRGAAGKKIIHLKKDETITEVHSV
ncbi:MAG: hypothetical protein IJZ79_02410 [Bacilli bacterium]|nr:hypothetical protein [Bacilli bacterium]